MASLPDICSCIQFNLWLMQLSVCVAENGPYHIKEDLSLERSEYGWDVNSNMIFVDQPINTGFSYSDVSMHTSLTYTANWPFNLWLASNDHTPQSPLATLHFTGPTGSCVQ